MQHASAHACSKPANGFASWPSITVGGRIGGVDVYEQSGCHTSSHLSIGEFDLRMTETYLQTLVPKDNIESPQADESVVDGNVLGGKSKFRIKAAPGV